MEIGETSGLSLKAIETFVAVSDEGSLTGGAQRLGTSISATSLRISNLEKALDVRLIERSAQRFELTEAGRLFRQRAMKILDELASVRSDFTTRQGSPHFVLRMAIVEDFDNHILPKWLGLLSEDFPNASFAVRSGPSHENFSILGGRAVDLIVAVDAMDPVDWIEEHPLIRDPYVLVTCADQTQPPGIGNLSDLPFIRYSRELHMGRQIEAQLRRIKFAPSRLHEFSSNQALFAMIAATGGWSITTAAAAHGTLSRDRQQALGLQFHDLPFPAFARNVSLYARRDILNDVPERAAAGLRSVLERVFSPVENHLGLPRLPEVILDPNS